MSGVRYPVKIPIWSRQFPPPIPRGAHDSIGFAAMLREPTVAGIGQLARNADRGAVIWGGATADRRSDAGEIERALDARHRGRPHDARSHGRRDPDGAASPQRRRRAAVPPADRALGQAAAIAIVIVIFAVLAHAAYGHRQRLRVGMQTGLAGLALWSFLMANAHGAGLMLIPVLMPLCRCIAGSCASWATSP
jgi:hypothetical protein